MTRKEKKELALQLKREIESKKLFQNLNQPAERTPEEMQEIFKRNYQRRYRVARRRNRNRY